MRPGLEDPDLASILIVSVAAVGVHALQGNSEGIVCARAAKGCYAQILRRPRPSAVGRAQPSAITSASKLPSLRCSSLASHRIQHEGRRHRSLKQKTGQA